jgi:hypothetical protein
MSNYVFRKITQTDEEAVEKCITKLIQQTMLYDFANVDEQMQDQVDLIKFMCKTNTLPDAHFDYPSLFSDAQVEKVKSEQKV